MKKGRVWAWRTVLAAVMALGSVNGAAAETREWGANVRDNRNRIASAMATLLIDKGAGALGSFSDVDLDGVWELLVSKQCAACRPRLLKLQGSSYVDLLEHIPLSEGANTPQVLDQTTRGYRDVRLGDALLTWNGERYASAASHSVLSTESFVQECTETDTYDFYGDTHEAAKVNQAMCSCVADRIMEMGFSQADLDSYLSMPLNVDGAQVDRVAQESPLIEPTCAIRHGFQDQLPVAPQMYATWTENYGELVGNPYYSGDPSKAENALDYERFMESCYSNPDLVRSARIRTGDRALAVCGCIAERATMAGAEQLHIDALASLYDFSKSESEVEDVAPGLIAFDDEQGSWCARRLSALVDQHWPESTD